MCEVILYWLKFGHILAMVVLAYARLASDVWGHPVSEDRVGFVRLVVFVCFERLSAKFLLTHAWDGIHTSLGSWGCRGKRFPTDARKFVGWLLFSLMTVVFRAQVADSLEFKRNVRTRSG